MINVLKKINSLLTKRQRKGLIVLTLLLFLGMILEVFGLGILVPALSILLDPENSKNLVLISKIKEFLPKTSDFDFSIYFLLFIVLIYFIKSLFLVFLGYKQNRFLTNITAYVSNTLFASYLSQPYSFHLNKNSSELIKNIQIEISCFYTFLLALITIFIEGGFVLSILITLIYIEPLGAISIGIFYGLLSIIFLKITKKKINYWGKLRLEIDSEVAKTALEGLGGIKDLIILGKTSFFIEKFSEKNYFKARLNANHATISQIPRFYLELISIIGLVSFIILQLFQDKETTSLIAILGVFVAATFRMIPSLNRIISASQSMKFYKSSIGVIYNEISSFNKIDKPPTNNEKFNFLNNIELKNVDFGYETNNQILNGINLKIEKNQTIGIIGDSGSGKSTLIDLLIGFHNPTRGEILIDGFSGLQTSQFWKSKIGYVSQNIFLTDDSIKNNIALGTSDEKIDNNRIIEILKQVKLDTFINSLENGFNTKVGERGVQLSGGQKQRIGIGRALYNNPEIIILDEATSALDNETEKSVMKSISNLKGLKTIIIIAHRLSTLDNCDVIYKIIDGKINKSI